ncbi:MAG: M56 family metallopeptidase [Gemmatimonadales bacterium]|nr:M56 family metallopeptidase [Gemmatimonadales bacterium]MYG48121.1 M56 family metallopeptidase [Gemmatimonadales bacterium]MYK00717.1 M56 family metallopeptidase [Candidatus Palauibacter ramosifaciens]
MTLATMIYGLIVAGLVGGAAWCLDRGLRAHGRPTRWVWLGALGVGGLAPFFPRFLPAAAATNGPGPLALPVRALYELGTPAASLPEQSRSFLGGVGLEDSLGALWIAGSILVLILFSLLCLRLRRLRTTWEPRDVCGEEVLRSERFGPAVVGLIRSRIVLPSWTFELGERDIEMVVLHEREHMRARDPALLATGLLLASLSPWNPAVWWSLVRLRLAVEGDCDRRVLARGTPVRSYARLLLAVAGGSRRTPEPVPALIRGGRPVIERRLMMIKTSTKKPRVRASILTAAAGLGLFALACDTPIPQSPAEPERASRLEGVVSAEGVAGAETAGPEAGVHLEGGIGYVDEDGTYRVHAGKWAVDPEAGFGYVDEDGIFQALDLDPEAKARIRMTAERLGRAKREIEIVRGRIEGEIETTEIPRDLWLRLGTAMENLENLEGSLQGRWEEMLTELAMEVRRLQAAFEAGEITRAEAEQTLKTHMGARKVRLRWPDRPH